MRGVSQVTYGAHSSQFKKYYFVLFVPEYVQQSSSSEYIACIVCALSYVITRLYAIILLTSLCLLVVAYIWGIKNNISTRRCGESAEFWPILRTYDALIGGGTQGPHLGWRSLRQNNSALHYATSM